MNKIKLIIVGILLLTAGGCFPVFVPVGHEGHEHHEQGGHRGGYHGDRD